MENSSNNKTWEEHMYWNYFNFSHFSLILPSDFYHRIALPKKFTDNMETNLPEQMVLKVNGVSWNVKLDKKNDDILFQGDGWEEFVDAYSLKKADLLVFKYNRRECFEVLIFDLENSCEKESSYFVRKGQQKNSNADNHDEDHGISRKTKESLSKDHDNAYSKDGHNDHDKLDTTSHEDTMISEEANTTPKNAARNGREFPSNAMRKRKLNTAKHKTSRGRKPLFQLFYKSNRREVTEEEIAKALEKARKTSAKCVNSFMVVMRPSCVYKRFYMTIPAEWKLRTRFKRGQEVTLRMEEKTWVCKISYTRKNIGFQGTGWRTFTRDNFLEEYDVCLFVPSGSKNESFVLDICIFRVVPEIVPPSLIK